MKTVYFVRHGESEANVGERFANDEIAPLTERGRIQAKALAKRCAKLRVNAIIASPMRRTEETAAIISKHIDMPIELSEEFVERPIPSVLHGRLRKDDETRRILDEWKNGILIEGNEFEEVKDRAGRALLLLQRRPESSILVVTHGYFMRTLLARVIFGETFTTLDFGKIVRAIPNTEKTHISALRYYEDSRVDPWKLWVWNDHAHLG